ncbi:hypothetical protein BC332_03723 [Capsicum chinense]|nr:hypothetical protein BC332_03723 [Capsicum chinense]
MGEIDIGVGLGIGISCDILIDVDNDMDTLDMICSFEDGDEMEVPVNHLVDEPIVGPMLLEDVSHGDMEESGASFNTRPKFRVDSTAAPSAAALSVTTINDIDVGPSRSNFSEEVEGSDYSTKDRVESEVELVEDDDNEEYDSNVHKKFRELRAEKREFQRRKKNVRIQTDNAKVPVGEIGPNQGFGETEID